MDASKLSSYGGTGVPEALCKAADPREMFAEACRQTFVTSWQPSACGDETSRPETTHNDLSERLAKVEEELRKKRVWSDFVETRLQHLESCQWQRAASDLYKMQEPSNPDPPYQEGHRSFPEAFPGGVTQKELQEKEDYKKLKEKVKELEERNKELLSKAMGMHRHSEDLNDPLRLSAVLQMYEMLRLHDWEKLRTSTASYLSYKTGSSIIKKLFDACEKDIEQRTTNILKVLDIPPSNDAMTNSKQGVMQEIRNLFRHSYYQNHSEFYSKIVMQAVTEPRNALQRQFTLQCCRIYCLLLLQDPPVKAVWNPLGSPVQDLEHVDMKGCECWNKPALLWPIMKCGEKVVVKGVVWDEK